MKFGIYSVRDTATGTYNAPFIAQTNAQAMRQFGDLAQEQNTNVNKHPDDFELFLVGTWDDDTSLLDNHEPQKLAIARDYNNEQTST